jgi:hypothetical protein
LGNAPGVTAWISIAQGNRKNRVGKGSSKLKKPFFPAPITFELARRFIEKAMDAIFCVTFETLNPDPQVVKEI